MSYLTVEDLIEALSEMPLDAPIYVSDRDGSYVLADMVEPMRESDLSEGLTINSSEE